jgi:predicted ATP-dependent endonuclease of OLD family
VRLARVEVRGFRKLVDTNCRFTGKLTAVVGPNEAGKSTLLELLKSARNNDAIPPLARPRGLSPSDEDVAFELWYRIDESDRGALSHLNAPEHVEWYVVAKTYGGERTDWTEPQLTRNQESRIAARAAVTRYAETQAATALERNEDRDGAGDRLDQLLEALDSEDELTDTVRSLVSDTATELGHVEASARSRRAAALVEAWQADVSGEPPDDTARSILDAREPILASFDDAQRNLASTYSIEEEADNPSPALRNLAKLAGLDLKVLRDAYLRGDAGSAETATNEANAALRETLNTAWQSSEVEVRLRQDGGSLHVLVRTDAPAYSTVAERSDGLKSFVALTAFSHRFANTQRPLVLLIDEAEPHLHYDAQADLIRMLERQGVASQVIYTTHSAGCLPSDLGTGVRAVSPFEGTGRSVITNSVWSRGPGFTPLLMALGATAAAFAPSRYAVIGEGATEMLLLPTMLREAIGQTERLDYQVAPGLAEVGNGLLRELELEAPRVAYVVDGDAGGANHAARLERAGLPPGRVVRLGGSGSGLSLENLLHEETYLAAVNAVLRQLGCSKFVPKSIFLSGKPDAADVKTWCTAQGYPNPAKPAVAVAVLESGREKILSRHGAKILRTLHRDILTALGIPLS